MTPFKIKKEISINAPVNMVWDAITDVEVIRQCFYGSEVVTDWEPGSNIVFQGTYQDMKYRDKGVIQVFDIEQKFEYTYWSSFSGTEDKPENYSIVSYELAGLDDGGTVLTLTQKNLATAEAQEHSEKNWGLVLAQMKEIIESTFTS